MIPISGILAYCNSPLTLKPLVFFSIVLNAVCKALCCEVVHCCQPLLATGKEGKAKNTSSHTYNFAKGCPTHRCLPLPNPICIAMFGLCRTNSWGFSKTVGSRFAALYVIEIGIPGLTVCP